MTRNPIDRAPRVSPLALPALGLALLLPAQWAGAALIGFYDFEGSAADRSGNANHGSVSGATQTASGYEGSAYDFDGANDRIQIPIDIGHPTLPLLTLGAWVNADSANAIRTILSHDNGGFDRQLDIDGRAGGNFRYSAFTGTGVVSAGPSPATTGSWIFVAARYNQSLNSLVLDVGDTRASFATGFDPSGWDFSWIGGNPSFGEYFDGRIDNVFLYDQILSDTRIDEIRLGGAAAILPQGPVPVPGTLALTIAALAGLGLTRARPRA
jgi:hypothetical protein